MKKGSNYDMANVVMQNLVNRIARRSDEEIALKTLNFVSEGSKKSNIVCFAMGEHGKISRLLSPFFGGFFTFASLTEKRKTAKGQLTIQEINFAYKALGLK